MPASDADLVARARRGDEAAASEIVGRYAPALYGLAVSMVGNAADAEDVLQETFAGAFRGLGGFEGRASLKTWLTRILVRQAARCHRRRGSRKTVPLDELSEPAKAVLAGSRPSPSAGELDLRMDVAAVLDTLSPDHREVIVLRELQGLSYEEIAEALGVPRGTVESRLFRARRHLAERLRDYLPRRGDER